MSAAGFLLVAAGFVGISAAGAFIARPLFGSVLRAGDLPLAGAVTGLTIFAAAATAAWRLGGPSTVAGGCAVAAAAAAALVAQRLVTERPDASRAAAATAPRESARSVVVRWALWCAVAVLFCGALHFRQVVPDGPEIVLRGTLGRETLVHAAVSEAISRGETDWPAFHSGPIRYHVFTHTVAAAATEITGIDPALVWALVLPPLLIVLALEAHRFLLCAWFPDGAAVRFAAVLPLLVTDFDAMLRIAGVPALEGVEHRLAHSYAVSPSFVAGQAVCCFALGAAFRVVGPAGPRTAAAVATGLLAGLAVGWKIPSAGVLSATLVALAVVCEGPRRRAAGVASGVAVVAGATAWAFSFGLGGFEQGGGTSGMSFAIPGAVFSATEPAASGWPRAAAILFVPLQVLGARALMVPEIVRRCREDGRLAVVLVSAALAVVVPLAVTVGGARHEEKYLVRAAGLPLLLVTGALAFDFTFGATAARRRMLGVAVLAVLAATSLWQLRQFATRPADPVRVTQSAR